MKFLRGSIFIVFVLTIVSSLFVHISSAIATDVCGGIYSDTTWTLANSPYNVTCDVVLFPGYTLPLSPG